MRDIDLIRRVFLALFVLLQESLWKCTERGLPILPLHCLLVTLHYFTTGMFQLVHTDLFGISQPRVSRIISKVSQVIALKWPLLIWLPTNEEGGIGQNFFQIAGFPGVTECLDCTHICIQSPGGENVEFFQNRKGYFSINVQAVCDANLSLVAQWPGSVHDSCILYNSSLCTKYENGKIGSILLGNNDYPNKCYLLVQIVNPQTAQERCYNRAHISTCNTVEQSFGVWKCQFSCLHTGLKSSMDINLGIIVATAVLHNFAILHRQELNYDDDNILEHPNVPAAEEIQDMVDERIGNADMSYKKANKTKKQM